VLPLLATHPFSCLHRSVRRRPIDSRLPFAAVRPAWQAATLSLSGPPHHVIRLPCFATLYLYHRLFTGLATAAAHHAGACAHHAAVLPQCKGLEPRGHVGQAQLPLPGAMLYSPCAAVPPLLHRSLCCLHRKRQQWQYETGRDSRVCFVQAAEPRAPRETAVREACLRPAGTARDAVHDSTSQQAARGRNGLLCQSIQDRIDLRVHGLLA
jgi:hypothetical protein